MLFYRCLRNRMELTLYQIDAFTDIVFKGNPAVVCPLDSWFTDIGLQAIAEENNLKAKMWIL